MYQTDHGTPTLLSPALVRRAHTACRGARQRRFLEYMVHPGGLDGTWHRYVDSNESALFALRKRLAALGIRTESRDQGPIIGARWYISVEPLRPHEVEAWSRAQTPRQAPR